MEGSEGLPNSRSSIGTEKKLRIVGPFMGIPPFYIGSNLSHVAEGSNGLNGSILKPTPTEAGIMKSTHHQRCSSESFLSIEEQPSWLEDLLDEPESPLWKGHRRSASDSSAYLDTSMETFNRRNEYMFNNFSTGQPWGSSQNYANGTNTNPASVNSAQSRSFCGQQSWASESSPNSSINFTKSLPVPATRDGSGSSSCGGPREDRSLISTTTDRKQDLVGSSASQKPENFGEKGNQFLQANNSASKADARHAKQKTAHRSRVRKLQYIAELERNVQVLQAEGSAIFAEFEFLEQRNLILSMENRALRQRFDCLSQEQLIKQMQHEMLEREVARLQALFQLQMQQQQQQQQRKQQNVKNNNRAKLKDLDSQFGNLSVSSNKASSTTDSTNASTRI